VTSPRPLLTDPIGRGYLATLAQLELDGKLPEGMPQSVVVVGSTTVRLGLLGEGGIDSERHRGELQKKLREIETIEAKLNNPDFTRKAPAAVVARERGRLAQARQAADGLRSLLGETGELG
jgi:valyl-tRNA synthetase